MATANLDGGLAAFTLLMVVLTACIVSVHFGRLNDFAFDDPYTVSAEDATRMKALWIDARDADDFMLSHVHGSVPINEETWDDNIPLFLERWDGKSPLVVYCEGKYCDRAQVVATRLRKETGFQDVRHVRGGWSSVICSGVAIEYKQ